MRTKLMLKSYPLILFLILFIAGCASSGNNGQNPENNLQNSPVQIIDGVQTVTLSWGKFNYAPEVIRVKADMPVRIIADLERLQGCFRSFVIPGLNVYKNLNYNDNIIEFIPQKAGTFRFTCTMGMGSGTLIVE